MPELTAEEIDRLAERVLATLQSWSDRFSNHVTHRRSYVRRGCLVKTSTIIPGQEHPRKESGSNAPIAIWVRNISSNGIGFISYGPIRADDQAIIVKLGPKNMLCEIVRGRQVHEGFWEYGSRFVKSLDEIDLENTNRDADEAQPTAT